MPALRRGAPAGGDVLDGRYELVAPVLSPAGSSSVDADQTTQLWRAEDTVLARPVAAKLVPARLKAERARAETFLAAAVATGAVSHPGLVRIFDAAVEPRTGGDVALVLSEWVDGVSLTEHLAQTGPLDVPEAADLLQQAADALTAAHAAGLVHGRVHPGNVLISATGRLRLTDSVVAATLHGTGSSTVAGDTRDLAAVLYALVTGRWPGNVTEQPARGLPNAGSGNRLLVPTKVRAGVPRAVDTVLLRALDPLRSPSAARIETPAALAAALEPVAADVREQRAITALPKRRSRLWRLVPYVVALAVLVAVAVGGYQLGIATGTLPHRDGTVESLDPTRVVPGTTTRVAKVIRPMTIDDFDPPPGDGSESPDQVPNATDSDVTTAWTTARYKTATFGGLKKGVGLLLDLGKPTAIGGLRLVLTTPGATVQLRTGDGTSTLGVGAGAPPVVTPPGTADALATVATRKAAPVSTTLTLATPVTARYALVWITQLPKDPSGGFRVGVAELALTT